MNPRSRVLLQFLALFALYFGLIFGYLHLDYYPLTTLSPLPLIHSLIIGILGGLGLAFYGMRNSL